jgi:virginiamycin B lyase
MFAAGVKHVWLHRISGSRVRSGGGQNWTTRRAYSSHWAESARLIEDANGKGSGMMEWSPSNSKGHVTGWLTVGGGAGSVRPTRWTPLALLLAAVLALVSPTAALAATFTEYTVPTPASLPALITAGPDGALWFTENQGNKIGRVTTGGSITEFSVPTPASDPNGITLGPDGALWFAEFGGNKIGRITTGGSISEFSVPTAQSSPVGITLGPDGALWFIEFNANKIGRITTGGSFSEFPIPTANSDSIEITQGPDGALWFTETTGNKIGRITTGGSFIEFPIPTANSHPTGITQGLDGALWFTEETANKIGRITTGGSFSEFPVPTANSNPIRITQGPDGALWFTETTGNKIGRITTGGSISEFSVPTPASGPDGITLGPDAALWFAEVNANKIGRIVPSAGPPANLTLAPKTQTATVKTQACLTATVTDQSGTPVPTVNVVFSVTTAAATQASPSSGTVATNSSGQATFCYSAQLPGLDAVHAFADTNNNGVQDSGEPFDDATVTWILPVSTPGCEIVIAGGWMIANNQDKVSFGGNAKISSSGSLSGQEQYTDSPANLNVHSINIQAIVCKNNFEFADIYGTATINGSGSFNFRIEVTDPDSTGGPDTYWILLSSGYNSGSHPLEGGTVEIFATS